MHLDQSSSLFGRDDETRTLKEAFEHCFGIGSQLGNPQEQHMVLIHGASGSGKTALATQTLRPILAQHKGLFLTGKADSTAQWSRPYAIFESAFQQLIQLLEKDRLGDPNVRRFSPTSVRHTDEKSMEDEIRDAILEEFGNENEHSGESDDCRLLNTVIPGFEKILKKSTSSPLLQDPFRDADRATSTDVTSKNNGNDAVARLRYLLVRLCRTIASRRPFVLFFDDIQWCDQASLQLLNSIVSPGVVIDGSSSETSSFMLICAYRDDEEHISPSSVEQASNIRTEPDEEKSGDKDKCKSPLFEFLEKWMTQASTNSSANYLKVHDIALNRVDEATLNEILSGVYSLPQMEFYSKFIYEVSAGNIYLALQCVRQLCEEGLLCQCEETKEWKWDFSQLQAQDDATAQFLLNPAFSDIVRHSITELSKPTQHLLSVASCFGMEIDPQVLTILFVGNDEDKKSEFGSSVETMLEEAIKEGLVVLDPIIGRYAFSHDRVQQAAHAMIEDVDALSFEVGYRLWKRCSPSMLTAKMFAIATLMNKGQPTPTANLGPQVGRDLLPKENCYAVAKLNLQAGEKAASIAAFSDASKYLENGVALLKRGANGGRTYWKDEYELTLGLLSATAEVQVFNQNFARVDDLIDEVCSNAKNLNDKYRALTARIHATSLQGNLQDAVAIGSDILRQLGERLSSKATLPIIISEQLRTMLVMRGKSNDSLLALPPMENKEKITAMNVINTMFYASVMAKSPHMIVLATKSIRLCLKYGMVTGSAVSFVMYAFALCLMGKVEDGFRYGELAMQLLQREQNRDNLAFVHAMYFFGVHHRKRPVRDGMEGLKEGTRVGLEVGDVDSALFNDIVRVAHTWYLGHKTEQVHKLAASGLALRKVHSHPVSESLLRVIFEAVNRLTDHTPYVDVDEYKEAVSSQTVANTTLSTALVHNAAWLAYLYRDFDAAHKVASPHSKARRKFNMATTPGIQAEWLDGMISVAAAREGINSKKAMSNAKQILKLMEKRARECPENRGQLYELLKAEYESVSPLPQMNCANNKNCGCVLDGYILAMEKALKEGVLHVAAIAAERAGDKMLRLGNMEVAQKYWDKAHTIYLEWGATAKARSLATFMMMTTTTAAPPSVGREARKQKQ